MLQSNPVLSGQEDLFRSRLDTMIFLSHRLVRLCGLVDWSGLESFYRQYYCADNGRPGYSIRLMCGLFLLREIEGVSDETVCERWEENPYWQGQCPQEI
ncbi:MAG: transposase [Alphaproteobacteria bacterium]|nr:transposase [Alphaproteobacteria bacterium]